MNDLWPEACELALKMAKICEAPTGLVTALRKQDRRSGIYWHARFCECGTKFVTEERVVGLMSVVRQQQEVPAWWVEGLDDESKPYDWKRMRAAQAAFASVKNLLYIAAAPAGDESATEALADATLSALAAQECLRQPASRWAWAHAKTRYQRGEKP